MADQLAFLPERVLTAAAMPGTGYRVQFFQSGTTTPVTVYSDNPPVTPFTQPIVCDASGVFPQVFSTGGAIKAVVTKPDASVFYTVDPVLRIPTSAAAASDVTFSPTGSLPFTNVQAAIEGSVAAAASGFNTFGLGITGNATLLANIDATGTGSGVYRFDATTTGTYPVGVAAADTGLVEYWRQSSAVAMQRLYHATSRRWFERRMTATTWGTWAAGTFTRYLTPVENPVGVSGVGFDFDWPEPVSEIIVFFYGTAPTATAQLYMQLKVAGTPVTTGYAGGATATAFNLPTLTAGTPGTGHSTIYRMEQAAASRWIHRAGSDVGRVALAGEVTGIRIFQNGTTFNGTGALQVVIKG